MTVAIMIFLLSGCESLDNTIGSLCKHKFKNDKCIYCAVMVDKYYEFRYIKDTDSYSIVKKIIDTEADVTIPNTYKGKSVTTIDILAFQNCYNLTNVTIPDSITTIGFQAFNSCPNLTNVTIPNSVTHISDDAFSWCMNLSNIFVDENNEHYQSIDGNLYSKCGETLIQYAIGKDHTSFTMPSSVTNIHDDAFKGCYNLSNIELSNNVTTIGDYAFYDCDNLASINIPSSVTTIGDSAFSKCDKLSNIIIPNSVTYIGSDVFAYCNSLTSVIISDSITTISNRAFQGCCNLKSIVIPNSVTSISSRAFEDCKNLTNISIGKNVTSIGALVLKGTAYYNDESNWINDSLYLGTYLMAAKDTIFGKYAIKHETTIIADYAFYDFDNLTILEIPDSVTHIGISSFWGCDNLNSIIIGDNVVYIDYYAFAYCNNLTVVYYKGSEEDWNNITIIIDGWVSSPLTNSTIHFNYVPEE